ncbi:PfkB family carbohydrate kinase [Dyadobacter chenwenxiniae]|uniref:PfkB family carbohydrate kinase n=1 Tax=Dyadobacter chenwenxiniae TaxID=2906456 RepID=A0A9X1TG35_9BACT|nr:PfkB family carbohydrate kinase [Dyadobacter chenwenxiniae]MCF0063612.1 PfkB family carbohydrate kinase [Dyadobacter chenwenxiniae]UON83288.1 PfkB family carbohydrate kinase [Dyadobacter chenwenxiniae]
MYDICTIGHITLDKVVTAQSVKYMPGGTSFYFSKALRQFDVDYMLVTALAEEENHIVSALRDENIQVFSQPSEHTVYFENIYSANQDHREQNVLHKAAPFTTAQMPDIESRIFHLGPLLSDDITVDLLKSLAQKGTVSLDIQGYLRYVKDQKVLYKDWADKKEALPHVSILKANEFEMEVVTGTSDVRKGAEYLADLGVKEVIITLGSKGSLIYKDNDFFRIPAYKPTAIVDATGCGDTYMAGYLSKKIQGADIQEAGEFGAAMATLKIQSSGPFSGNAAMVEEVLQYGECDREMIAHAIYQ